MSDKQPDLVYLITGGSGFLGKHLVRLLLEKEDKVTEIRVFDKCPDPRLNELGTGEKRSPVLPSGQFKCADRLHKMGGKNCH